MQPSAQRAEPNRLEVLICTHNRVGLLERTLDSLNACSRPAGCEVSVFVVANACTDETPQYLESYVQSQPDQQRLPLRWIEEPRPGKSQALNTAIPQVTAPVIAFVDDDHRVDAGYLTAVCTAANEQPDADLFCGRILPDWDGTEPDWVHDQGQYRIYPLPVPRFELGAQAMPVEPGTATPGGGNLAIRRKLYDRVGPFLLELGPHGHDLGGAEDIEWVRRAIGGGARLYYIPAMLQYRYVDGERLTLQYVMAKAYERSASLIRLSSELADRPRLLPLHDPQGGHLRPLCVHLPDAAATPLLPHPPRRRDGRDQGLSHAAQAAPGGEGPVTRDSRPVETSRPTASQERAAS